MGWISKGRPGNEARGVIANCRASLLQFEGGRSVVSRAAMGWISKGRPGNEARGVIANCRASLLQFEGGCSVVSRAAMGWISKGRPGNKARGGSLIAEHLYFSLKEVVMNLSEQVKTTEQKIQKYVTREIIINASTFHPIGLPCVSCRLPE